MTVWEGFETIDLLNLRNCALFDLVPPTAVPAGAYAQVRLRIVPGEAPRFVATADLPFPNFVELSDGSEQPLTVPSGEQSGAKIAGPFEVAPGGSLQVLADFDLRRSLHLVQAGASGRYNLRPVLRVVEGGPAAAIRGEVRPDDAAAFTAADRPVVYAWQGTGDLIDAGTGLVDATRVVASAIPNTDPLDAKPEGSFCLGPLEAGTYNVTAVAGIETDAATGADRWDRRYLPASQGPVTVGTGQELPLPRFTLQPSPAP